MFGQWLRQERERRNWNQGELAQRAGLTQGAISHIEQGRRKKPTYEVLHALAGAFNLSVDEMMVAAGLAPSAEPDELAALLREARGWLSENLLEAIKRGVEDMPHDIRAATIRDLRADLAAARARELSADTPAQPPRQEPSGGTVQGTTQASAAIGPHAYGYAAAPARIDVSGSGLHEAPALYFPRG